MHVLDHLVEQIKKKNNPICVGIDPNINNIPGMLRDTYFRQYGKSPMGASMVLEAFSREIIDAVADHVPAVKFQMAYFEMFGHHGLKSLEQVVAYAKQKGLLIILDGKRNDIGSTAQAYSSSYLGVIHCGEETIENCYNTDFLTVNPYLGSDGLKPFMEDAEKYNRGIFILTKTSNPSAAELQDKQVDGIPVYKHVAQLVHGLSDKYSDKYQYSRLGIVVGATYPKELTELRESMPNTFFLIPGFGFQGAGADELKGAFRKDTWGALIVSARNIVFAYRRKDYKDRFREDEFVKAAETAVKEMAQELSTLI